MTILGLGGTGKTQLALQFAYLVQEAEPNRSIFWMPAVSMESFETACMDIAAALGIPPATIQEEDPKELVKERLSSSSARPWLLIVDNADDTDVCFELGPRKGIVDYLPQSPSGMVVYTTRTPAMAELTPGDVIELGEMSRQDAEDFLFKSLTRKDLLRHDKASKKLVDELLDELTCLPLAIAQAAAYLNKNRMPIFKYLHLLQNTEQDLVSLMSKEFRDNTRYLGSANAVATTWVVSFSQIRKSNATAADLLAFMSCMEWKAIPRSLLPRSKSEVGLEDAIGTLCGYSFLVRRENTDGVGREEHDSTAQSSGEELFDIHRLVHLATRIWIKKYGDSKRILESAILSVEQVFPNDRYENRHVWRAYMPHVLRLLKAEQYCDVKATSSLCLLVGRCLREDRRLREAVTWLEASCRLRRNLEEDDPALLFAQHSLAAAFLDDGQIEKAIQLLEIMVNIRPKVPNADYPSRFVSQKALATAYKRYGQAEKAVALLEVAVQARETLESDHSDRLELQVELAGAYQGDGQVEKAIELLEVVVQAMETLGSDDPHRLLSQVLLANAYRAIGQNAKAIALIESVVKTWEHIVGPDQSARLALQHLLAMTYKADGQVQRATGLIESIVEIQSHTLEPDHPHLLASQHLLAMTYEADGRVQKAICLLESIVEIESSILRADHPHLLTLQHNLATVYQSDGQVQKAICLLESTVEIQSRILRADHPHLLMSRHNLAIAYQADGQTQRAIELMTTVVELKIHSLRKDDPDLLPSVQALAKMHADLAASSGKAPSETSSASPAEETHPLPKTTSEDERAVWESFRQAMIL